MIELTLWSLEAIRLCETYDQELLIGTNQKGKEGCLDNFHVLPQVWNHLDFLQVLGVLIFNQTYRSL